MALTQKHSDTVRKDLQSDRRFRVALLGETINCMASGDMETGKIVLREYINATIGFVGLGEAIGKSPKSLMRMVGPRGNPNAKNLFEMLAYLQKIEGTELCFKAVRRAA